MEFLKNPLVIGGFAGVTVTFLAYLDKKYNETQYTNGMLLKIFLLVTLITSIIIYLISNNTLQIGGGTNNTRKVEMRGGGTRSYDVYANVPDF